MRLTIGRWVVEHDAEATRTCFAKLPEGSGCDCAYCRNFTVAIQHVFPEAFVSLAATLGIDLAKPSELTHWSREPSGLYLTGAWYHFAGSIVEGANLVRRSGDSSTFEFEELVPGFEFGFDRQANLVPEPFAGLPVSQLEFLTRIPWMLPEPEPT